MVRLILTLAVLAMLSGSALTAPSCSSIIEELAPCLNYLKGNVNDPSQSCCLGVKAVADAIKNKDDRQAACQCLKQILSKIGNYDASRIPNLPKKCGASVSLPPIDKNTDCSKATVYFVV